MKTLTIYQPHASLIAVGAKRFETRRRKTNYRGPIAIHAGLTPLKRILKMMFPLHEWSYAPDYTFKRKFVDVISKYINIETLCYGAIIATAELVECYCIVQHSPSTGRIVTDKGVIDPVGDELLFGDWTPGRYLWELANVQVLPEPIPARGQQGLWTWDERDC